MMLLQISAAFYGEAVKAIHSRVFGVIFSGFSMIPLMGTLFAYIVRNPKISEGSPLLQAKVNLAAFTADWAGYLEFLNTALSVGGVVGFGFIASWVFGREYSDRTLKDILVLPVSRGVLLAARFLAISVWGIVLSVWVAILGTILALILDLPGFSETIYTLFLIKLVKISVLVLFVSFPVALFACWGKGYMAPLGFVIFTLLIGQLMGILGFGAYSPWSVPGLYAGVAGKAMSHLGAISFIIVILTGFAGIAGTYFYWKNADV
jgi:ABC-2 type transport system permease protein